MNPLDNLIKDFESGISFKEELEKNYKFEENLFDVNRFIEDLQTLYKNLGDKRLNIQFHECSLENLNLSKTQARKISELGLKLTLENKYSEILDDFFDKGGSIKGFYEILDLITKGEKSLTDNQYKDLKEYIDIFSDHFTVFKNKKEFFDLYRMQRSSDEQSKRQFIEKIKSLDLNPIEILSITDHLNDEHASRLEPIVIALVKEAVLKPGGARVSEHMLRYNITNEVDRIEIAKIAAQQDGLELAKYLPRYNITDQRALEELAFLAIAQNPDASEYIPNFNISDQKILFKLAMLSASLSGRKTSVFIAGYNIADEEDKFKIALRAARQDGAGTSQFLSKYQIKDPEKRFKILLECIKSSPNEGIGFACQLLRPPYRNFREILEDAYYTLKIQNENTNLDFPSEISQIKNDFKSKHTEVDLDGMLNKIQEEDPLPPRDLFRWLLCISCAYDLRNIVQENWPEVNLDKIFRKMESKDLFVQRNLFIWLTWTVAQLTVHKVKGERLKELVEKGVLQEIAEYRDPMKRYQLGMLLLEVATQDKAWEFYQKKQWVAHAKIPALFLASLAKDGISEDILNKCIEDISSNRQFRIAANSRILINTLQMIALDENDLTNKDKEHLIQLITPSNSSQWDLKKMQALQGIAGANVERLQMDHMNAFHNDLEILYMEAFKDKIPVSDIENFSEKYASHFSKFLRQPEAILIYASRLNTLPAGDRKKGLDLLATYVRDVLEDQFYIQRYQMTPGSHLEKIFKGRDNLLTEWQKGGKESLADLLPAEEKSLCANYNIEDTDNPYDLLLCGLEVAGSCMAVDGNARENRCLLAYLVDGKNRMIAIKNKETGKIEARGIFKMLWDDTKKAPVLFLETIYPKHTNSAFVQGIKNMALKRAGDLGVEVLNKVIEQSDSYEGTVSSLGSRAPYEYVDSISLPLTNGKYTISNVYYLKSS